LQPGYLLPYRTLCVVALLPLVNSRHRRKADATRESATPGEPKRTTGRDRWKKVRPAIRKINKPKGTEEGSFPEHSQASEARAADKPKNEKYSKV
jgi:hypothetical protein